jgi:hypothetical protein
MIRRIHITGGPGSGKSTLAGQLSHALAAPVYDLDSMALEFEARGVRPPFEAVALELPAIVEGERWVTEGVYMTWAKPLFDHADMIVWMDVPGRVALFRIVARHLKAELARNNRFPGWRRLFSILGFLPLLCRREHGFHGCGTPNSVKRGPVAEAYRASWRCATAGRTSATLARLGGRRSLGLVRAFLQHYLSRP